MYTGRQQIPSHVKAGSRPELSKCDLMCVAPVQKRCCLQRPWRCGACSVHALTLPPDDLSVTSSYAGPFGGDLLLFCRFVPMEQPLPFSPRKNPGTGTSRCSWRVSSSQEPWRWNDRAVIEPSRSPLRLVFPIWSPDLPPKSSFPLPKNAAAKLHPQVCIWH